MARGLGMRWSLRFLPSQTFLWFYDLPHIIFRPKRFCISGNRGRTKAHGQTHLSQIHTRSILELTVAWHRETWAQSRPSYATNKLLFKGNQDPTADKHCWQCGAGRSYQELSWAVLTPEMVLRRRNPSPRFTGSLKQKLQGQGCCEGYYFPHCFLFHCLYIKIFPALWLHSI